ncbi:hypothetical protein ACS127_07555 [Amphibacillus sp. Q70]|uniref:hypothetical protein n=1 Tax=Amphibacillus sp. Q70 TaxID=3453416 RepID=UPI003F834BD5
MKKKLKTMVWLELYLLICMMIGVFLAKPTIETELNLSFWGVFGIVLLSLVVIFSLNSYFYYRILKKRELKKGGNIPEVDERTFENMKTAMEWACVIILLVSSLLALSLLFLGVEQVETDWLVMYMISMWFILMGSLLIGKLR